MKRLVKNGKVLVAYISAFAILAVSLLSAFTGVGITALAKSGTASDQWDGNFDTELAGGGTEGDPYLITSAEELAAVCYGKATGATSGSYFKVSGVDEFYMDSITAPATVKGLASATAVYNHYNAIQSAPEVWNPNTKVQLNFDGNGATVYGLYMYNVTYAGLFAIVTENTSIKNIAVKNSYGYSSNFSGFIAGQSSWGVSGTVTIENCMVVNNYLWNTSGNTGEIIGHAAATPLTINNCLVADNALYYTSAPSELPFQYFVRVSDVSQNIVTNCVAIDVVPQVRGCAGDYSNNYYYGSVDHSGTDITRGVTELTSADMAKGTAAATNLSGLDKSNWFFNTTTYPEPSVFHETELADNGDGTHSEACACGLKGIPVEHTVADNKCECGYIYVCGSAISVYSGTPDTTSTLSGTGTENKPYIIDTADQFAAIALGKSKYDQGSYFKVNPSIDAFYMNGGKTVAAMTDVADVTAYFETNGGYDWASNWGNTNADEAFSGHFDGSGVTIYGLYDVGYNSGLFEMAEDSSSFKNFALKNSYIKVSSGAGVAAVVGKTSKQANADYVTIENVTVANNHIEQTNTGSGAGASVMVGYLYNNSTPNDGVKINNCLIYGNNIVNPNPSATYGLVSVGGNGSADLTQITNVISLGVRPYTLGQGWFLKVLDGNKCFVNVYTDQDCSAMANYSEENKTAYNVKDNLNIADLQGASAIDVADKLAWDTTWIATANGLPELRVLHGDQLTVSAVGYSGHKEVCSCGLTGVVTTHTYDSAYKCTVCGFVCDHNDEEHYTYNEVAGADHVTSGTYTKECECGYTDSGSLNDATEHNFKDIDEVSSADCQTHGVAAHKYCSLCDKNYATDADTMASLDTALSDDDLKLPVADHTPDTDDSGIIYKASDAGHEILCAICNTLYGFEAHDADFVQNGATGHSGQCTICKFEVSAQAGHKFNGDNVCDDCEWTCENHNYVNGDVIAEGDCTTDRVVATYCEICKIAGDDKVTTAPGHTEGDTVTENVVAATCTTDGSHDEVVYCTVCEDELSRDDVIDEAFGHTDGDVVTENEVAADCTTDGSHDEVVYCTVCEEEISRETVTDAATGHDLKAVAEVAATTEAEGVKAHYECQVCEALFEDENGETETTTDKLVIEKLASTEDDNSVADKDEDKDGSTTDTKEDNTANTDNNTESPNTGEGIAIAAMIAIISIALFALIRKLRIA